VNTYFNQNMSRCVFMKRCTQWHCINLERNRLRKKDPMI